jgi:hypothetical protein
VIRTLCILVLLTSVSKGTVGGAESAVKVKRHAMAYGFALLVLWIGIGLYCGRFFLIEIVVSRVNVMSSMRIEIGL